MLSFSVCRRVGDKWTMQVIVALQEGPRRLDGLASRRSSPRNLSLYVAA
jgi:DNA-binding HxlR family transcriptional regulator